MDGIKFNTLLQVLVLLICVYICVIDGVRCPRYMRRRCGGPFNCNLVRNGRRNSGGYGGRRARYRCNAPRLRQASGRLTGPGRGIRGHGIVPPHSHNNQQPININIEVNNANNNTHAKTNSDNTHVGQVQAPEQQCGTDCRPDGSCEHQTEICVYSDNCGRHVCRTRFIPH